MRTLYFDCFAGVSGNMILGALVGLGLDPGFISETADMLGLEGIEVEVSTVDRSGIAAIHVALRADDQSDHRHLSDINRIIDGSSHSLNVRSNAKAVFRRLAEAEAKVHGIEIEKVHFHEVGAIDAIVDIVGACYGFELLGAERLVSSRINVGSGVVEMAHGIFPVPPPAVSELLKGWPVYSNFVEGELTTPTGAAIISTLCDSYVTLPNITLEQIGYGAGTRKYDKFPNVLRILIGHVVSSVVDNEDRAETEQLVLLETNIDDSTPQVLAYVQERAFSMGALDCWLTPIQMKKGRPGAMITILCRYEQRESIEELLFRETTTLGVRAKRVDRSYLEREIVSVETGYGRIDVKLARHKGKVVNVMPEYENVASIAREKGEPFRVVSEAAISSYYDTARSKSAKR